LYLIYCQISPLITPLTATNLGYVAERGKKNKQKETTQKNYSLGKKVSAVSILRRLKRSFKREGMVSNSVSEEVLFQVRP